MSGFVRVPLDSTGKFVDTSELQVGINTVERQRVVIADPVAAANLAGVVAGALKVDNGLTKGEGLTDATTLRTIEANGATLNCGQAAVSTTAALALAANPTRLRLVLVNTGTTAVYVGSTAGVTTANGMLLAGVIGYPMVWHYYQGAIYVIGTAAGSVSYMEEAV